MSRHVRTLGLAALTIAALGVTGVRAGAAGSPGAEGVPTSRGERATAATAIADKPITVTAVGTDAPVAPTPEQQAAADAYLATHPKSPAGQKLGTLTASNSSPAQAVPSSTLLPTDLSIFRQNAGPTAVLPSPSGRSSVMEPSVTQQGNDLMVTGNWYAAYNKSFPSAAAWTYLNPYTIFPGNFCCDQVVAYDQARNRVYWVLQYTDGSLKLAGSNGGDMASWCSYSFAPSNIGVTGEYDYNDMVIGRDYLYLPTNVFPSAGGYGSVMLRFPLDALQTCSGFSYNYVYRTDWFTFKPVRGATDTMYFGSNWQTSGTLGLNFALFAWSEAGTGYSATTYNTTGQYAFYTRNSGQNCASTDVGLTVKNWCAFGDSRVLAGARAAGSLYFAWGASQGVGRPFPYTKVIGIKEADLTLQGYSDVWGTFAAFLYPAFGVSPNDDVGAIYTFGGGTPSGVYYPSGAIAVIDDVAGFVQAAYPSGMTGAGNPCISSGYYRWGDYNTVNALTPMSGVFTAATYRMTTTACGSQQVAMASYGRTRSTGDWNRWKGK